MFTVVVAVLASLIPMLPIGAYIMNRRTNNPLQSTRNLVLAFKGYNLLIALMAVGLAAVWLASTEAAYVTAERFNFSGGMELA